MPTLKSHLDKDDYICAICAGFPWPIRAVAGFLERIIVFFLARRSMQAWNDMLLAIALKGRGYNNCCALKTTGEVRFLKNLSKLDLKYCVDVGANEGSYSHELLSHTSAKVLAFEPLPVAYEKLRNLNRVHGARFIPVNCGLGAEAGTCTLRYNAENSGLASFEPSSQNISYVEFFNRDSVDATIGTLDAFSTCPGLDFDFANIDLLKIDTEGFEYKVLQGARDLISRHPPRIIQIEFNWHQLFTRHTLHDFHLLLPQYDVFQILPHGKGMRKVDPSIPENNLFLFSNFVFIRSDMAPEFKDQIING